MRLVNKWITPVLALAFIFETIQIPAQAAEFLPSRTTITFSRSVELPGIVLAPGRYIFKASESGVVQVFDAKESTIYGAFLTLHSYRLEPLDKTVVTLEERETGAPPAVKGWTDAGEVTGHEFIYHDSH
jgi:hypothetical protein